MTVLLFHKDVYIPDHAKVPLHPGKLRYSNHALNVASGTGEYPPIDLPAEFPQSGALLIEVELCAATGHVEKQLWRVALDADWDLCFPMVSGGTVKTVWLNHRTDNHTTLRKNKFITGYQWRCMKSKVQSGSAPRLPGVAG